MLPATLADRNASPSLQPAPEKKTLCHIPLRTALCTRCEMLKNQCAEMNEALIAAQNEVARLTRNVPLVSAAVQTKAVKAMHAVVQAGETMFAAQTCNASSQTLVAVTIDQGIQHCRELGISSASVQTLPDQAPVMPHDVVVVEKKTVACNTCEPKIKRKDAGCLAYLEDEDHIKQRKVLLTKIDSLLAETEQLRKESNAANHENAKLRHMVEHLNNELDAPMWSNGGVRAKQPPLDQGRLLPLHLEDVEAARLPERPMRDREASTPRESLSVAASSSGHKNSDMWAEFSCATHGSTERVQRTSSRMSNRASPGLFLRGSGGGDKPSRIVQLPFQMESVKPEPWRASSRAR